MGTTSSQPVATQTLADAAATPSREAHERERVPFTPDSLEAENTAASQQLLAERDLATMSNDVALRDTAADSKARNTQRSSSKRKRGLARKSRASIQKENLPDPAIESSPDPTPADLPNDPISSLSSHHETWTNSGAQNGLSRGLEGAARAFAKGDRPRAVLVPDSQAGVADDAAAAKTLISPPETSSQVAGSSWTNPGLLKSKRARDAAQPGEGDAAEGAEEASATMTSSSKRKRKHKKTMETTEDPVGDVPSDADARTPPRKRKKTKMSPESTDTPRGDDNTLLEEANEGAKGDEAPQPPKRAKASKKKRRGIPIYDVLPSTARSKSGRQVKRPTWLYEGYELEDPDYRGVGFEADPPVEHATHDEAQVRTPPAEEEPVLPSSLLKQIKAQRNAELNSDDLNGVPLQEDYVAYEDVSIHDVTLTETASASMKKGKKSKKLRPSEEAQTSAPVRDVPEPAAEPEPEPEQHSTPVAAPSPPKRMSKLRRSRQVNVSLLGPDEHEQAAQPNQHESPVVAPVRSEKKAKKSKKSKRHSRSEQVDVPDEHAQAAESEQDRMDVLTDGTGVPNGTEHLTDPLQAPGDDVVSEPEEPAVNDQVVEAEDLPEDHLDVDVDETGTTNGTEDHSEPLQGLMDGAASEPEEIVTDHQPFEAEDMPDDRPKVVGATSKQKRDGKKRRKERNSVTSKCLSPEDKPDREGVTKRERAGPIDSVLDPHERGFGEQLLQAAESSDLNEQSGDHETEMPNSEAPLKRTRRRRKNAQRNVSETKVLQLDELSGEQEVAIDDRDNTQDDGTGQSGRKKRRKSQKDTFDSIQPEISTPRTHRPKASEFPDLTPAERKLANVRDLSGIKPEIRKNGQFSGDEQEIVRRAIRDYQDRHGLETDELVRLIQYTAPYRHSGAKTDERVQSNLTSRIFWQEMYDQFGGLRKNTAIQKWVRRHYTTFKAGGWDEEEDRTLKGLVNAYPNQWKKIAEVMGTRAEHDIYDRYRNYLQCGEGRNTARWSSDEEDLLRKTMAKLKKIDMEYRASKGLPPLAVYKSKDFNWAEVAKQMGGIRSRIQCLQKWKILQRDDQDEHNGTRSKRRKYKSRAIVDDDEAAEDENAGSPRPKKRRKSTKNAHATKGEAVGEEENGAKPKRRLKSTKKAANTQDEAIDGRDGPLTPSEPRPAKGHMRWGNKLDLIDAIVDGSHDSEASIDWHKVSAEKLGNVWPVKDVKDVLHELIATVGEQPTFADTLVEIIDYMTSEHGHELEERYNQYEHMDDDGEHGDGSNADAYTVQEKVDRWVPTPKSSRKSRKSVGLAKTPSKSVTSKSFKSNDLITASDEER